MSAALVLHLEVGDNCGLITPEQFRTLFNLSVKIPDEFLQNHIDNACRQVLDDVQIPAGGESVQLEPDYLTALAYQAYIQALPFLHTFTMQGAGQAADLAANVDARFMSPAEVSALQDNLRKQYDELIRRLKKTLFSNNDQADSDSFTMFAIGGNDD